MASGFSCFNLQNVSGSPSPATSQTFWCTSPNPAPAVVTGHLRIYRSTQHAICFKSQSQTSAVPLHFLLTLSFLFLGWFWCCLGFHQGHHAGMARALLQRNSHKTVVLLTDLCPWSSMWSSSMGGVRDSSLYHLSISHEQCWTRGSPVPDRLTNGLPASTCHNWLNFWDPLCLRQDLPYSTLAWNSLFWHRGHEIWNPSPPVRLEACMIKHSSKPNSVLFLFSFPFLYLPPKP